MLWKGILRLRSSRMLRMVSHEVSRTQVTNFSSVAVVCTCRPLHRLVPLSNYTAHRWKKTSSSSKKDDDSDEEVDWDDDDRSLSRDSRIIKFKAPSMRMDLIIKSALGTARNKIEKQFYESRIRVNGKKVMKKSVQIHPGDEVDVIKGFSPKNKEHILVSRVEVLDAKADDDEIVVSARRFKTLLIENYDQDPYKESTADANS